ncbi:DHA1 family purine ribonucleoside efflux pump-like MFS transporter [Methanococcus maripaludis]|uniref:DHA1 family purine ribonucleoside efflux pump-like MFS transporter n=1 Tax=Methanococcus maripaludis TaxID=39152 RepID=A0A7J9S916_METMI|nr:MFS transporter [Methanococcus maripaludis]MBB6402526.1 DHA1 family purine ribonucleoside efflux pump-like MFS transporter [Methanococcus maripaludis]
MEKNTNNQIINDNKLPWGAIWAMSLCAMVLVASEFMPVSLLTPIATDLQITEGTAGQSISISGLFALITSLFLTQIIGNKDRRHVLLFFTALTGLSGILVAFAPDSTMLMIGRALLGMCIGGFWSMSAATVMRIVSASSVPKALAILNGGTALSTTVAAPMGSFLGGIIGWRGAFFMIVPLTFIAFIWQYKSIPKLPKENSNEQKEKFGSVLGLLKNWKVTLGMISVMLFFMGQSALFTYLRPFLEIVTRVNVETLSLVLLSMGIFGLMGTFIIEIMLKKRLYSLIIIIPFLMAITALLMLSFGTSLAAIFVLISIWGFLATSAPVAWWTWLSRTLPTRAEAGGGLMVAIIQLAITLGAAFGGVFFDTSGYKITFMFSALILGIATIMACITGFHVYRVAKNKN